jgi:hypothetical protein
MTNLWVMVLVLALAPSTAVADDALVLDEGVELERSHRLQNGLAAGLTASLLTYESIVLIKGAIETEPGGGLVDLSWLGKGVGYTLGTATGIGAVTMFGLMIHDAASAPVADARAMYRSGDHLNATSHLAERDLSKRSKGLRVGAWLCLGIGTGLFTYGAIAYPSDHDLGKANMWVGGTIAMVYGTVLLHLREPVAKRTYRRFTFGVTPNGVAAAGVF